MSPSRVRFRRILRLLALASVAVLAAAACAPQAAAPTAVPAKPAPTAAPAQPAPTAPAKVEVAAPKPAATTAPAAKPTEKPAARAAEFDEKAIADFYKGKTIRIVVGYAPGGAVDTGARLIQRVLSKYIPGNPAVVVENKPGGGGLLSANTVYNSEPKDGTVIANNSSGLILLNATGDKGVQFDSARYQWLASSYDSMDACAARPETGITRIEDIMGPNAKELTVASFGKGNVSYNPPATMNAALGTRFNIVTGYDGGAAQRLAVQNKEVQGLCTNFESMTSVAREMFEGSNPAAKIIIVTGSKTPDHPWLKGVPAAETLAKTDEARAMLKAIYVPGLIMLPYAAAPEVPKERVQALRRAFDRAFTDPEYLAGAQKANQTVAPKTGEEVTRFVQEMLSMPPATRDKLKQALE